MGAEKIGKGDLEARLDLRTGDEFEELAEAFNRMVRNLRSSKERMEEQNRELQKLNEVKSNFLSLVSHELRTPLMIIQESVSQILDGLKGPITGEQRDFLSMTKRNVQRLNKIIEDLLNISRIESGKMVLRRSKADVGKAILEEVELHRFRAKEKGIRFVTEIPGPPIILYCDEQKVRIIVGNLVSNAIKFTPEGGEVRTQLLDRDAEVEMIVSDTGPGIPPDFQPRVFGKFERLDTIPMSGVSSTGLGLAISRELVLMHRGRIWFETEQGRGTRFHVAFHKYSESTYFKEFFQEKIAQAGQRSTDLSVVILRLTAQESVFVDPLQKRKLFSHLVNMSFSHIFDYEEIIPLKNMDEIYAFLFTDDRGAGVIIERLSRTITEYLAQKRLKETFLVSIISVCYPEDGQDARTLLQTAGRLLHYLEPLRKKTKRLGQMLLEKGLVDEEALRDALQEQERSGHFLGRILIDRGVARKEEVAAALGSQLGLPVFRKDSLTGREKKLFPIFTKEFMMKYRTVPVDLRDRTLTVAMVNPFDIPALKQVYRLTESRTVVTQIMMEQDFSAAVEAAAD
jgi:signal transduction histidine kinase